eukprot:GDKI01048686.1.p1 GENE.GDKI01048686.1~~GDKI01048686.1.p1  ORF type:complete len:540 (-),score=172.93 GDKI01048686.1:405-1997(-)
MADGSTTKPLPVPAEKVHEAVAKYPTPFHLYDEHTLRSNARRLSSAFKWVPEVPMEPGSKPLGFQNHFAVKALPNPAVMEVLRQEGMGVDCSSMAELLLAEAGGFGRKKDGSNGWQIMFTSNNTPLEEYEYAKRLGAMVNFDDLSHIEWVQNTIGLPEYVSFRYNPGPRRTGNVIIGDPKEAKFGLTRDQLILAYKQAKMGGAKRFGLHAMVVSNCLSVSDIEATARMLFELVIDIHTHTGCQIQCVNLGGGIGVSYKPEHTPADVEGIAIAVKKMYLEILQPKIEQGVLSPVRIIMENGRFVTGPAGVLVTRVVHQKDTYKNYIGVDACMSNLMRPGMYDAYHHITVLPVDGQQLPPGLPSERDIFERSKFPPPTDARDKPVGEYDIVGGLCENNDKFAVDRRLDNPKPRIGDLLVIHDAGAHGHSMGFNYNGKLRSAELLLTEQGQIKCVRRAEGYGDLFGTLIAGCEGQEGKQLRSVLKRECKKEELPSMPSECPVHKTVGYVNKAVAVVGAAFVVYRLVSAMINNK